MDFEFEWDELKNITNKNKHGIDFIDAVRVFYDDMKISQYDGRNDYHEDRFQVLGMSYEKILFVVYTERNGNIIRIISARKAEKREVVLYMRGGF